ncbi:DoxX family protein [Aliivibrio fischeri]|uniref:DoxX family protein n=1 Tax=Aliivibrio fischeri TaxID=668 RepID=UPI0012D9B0CE|nr:DoxX family protein [Aliivibrio fischeri]MUH97130.1 DoxX family membrane protein [Aliivibrio fischeri]MUI64049.1 DoxX family membrane protein [Aliivibrio fischeri]USR97412.1 DoxX family protein [Aliivibrio fischeri ATCC 7744 = JCM 18803 = DSM 507]GGK31259.1 membrane protein [Aliivibrio fischeri]
MNTLLLTAGRLLLALYFLIPGIMKFVSWDMHIQLMEKHEMPFVPVLLGLAGVFQIGAAILLIANRFTWIVALLLAGLVLVINVSLHDFWNYSGMEGAHEMQNFIKNLGIFAGLLVLSGHSMPECCKIKRSHNKT